MSSKRSTLCIAATCFALVIGSVAGISAAQSETLATPKSPLASPQLSIRNTKDSPVSGTWYGRFPAPPKDIKEVSLTIQGVETIDAIPVVDK